LVCNYTAVRMQQRHTVTATTVYQFYYSIVDDELLIPKSSILANPHSTTATGRTYNISAEEQSQPSKTLVAYKTVSYLNIVNLTVLIFNIMQTNGIGILIPIFVTSADKT